MIFLHWRAPTIYWLWLITSWSGKRVNLVFKLKQEVPNVFASNSTLSNAMHKLLTDEQLIERTLEHIDNKTTDMGTDVWREPMASYLDQDRFDAEIALIRRSPVPFCPTAMLAEKGSYVARKAAGTPILVLPS